METDDLYYMSLAIGEAKKALKTGDVPVGCVIVRDGRVIARARNEREHKKDATCHAELTAIRRACRRLHGWRLTRCTLYVTLEPCPMCAGAMINCRLPRLVYGACDEKGGAVVSGAKLFDSGYNHRPEVSGGVMGAECSELLKSFFAALRR